MPFCFSYLWLLTASRAIDNKIKKYLDFKSSELAQIIRNLRKKKRVVPLYLHCSDKVLKFEKMYYFSLQVKISSHGYSLPSYYLNILFKLFESYADLVSTLVYPSQKKFCNFPTGVAKKKTISLKTLTFIFNFLVFVTRPQSLKSHVLNSKWTWTKIYMISKWAWAKTTSQNKLDFSCQIFLKLKM